MTHGPVPREAEDDDRSSAPLTARAAEPALALPDTPDTSAPVIPSSRHSRDIEDQLREQRPFIRQTIVKMHLGPHVDAIEQQALWRLYQVLKKPGFAFTKDDGGRGLVYRITEKAVADWKREQARRSTRELVTDTVPETSVADDPDMEWFLLTSSIDALLAKTITDPQVREVYRLSLLHAMNTSEIARALGIDRGTARKRLAAARQLVEDDPDGAWHELGLDQ